MNNEGSGSTFPIANIIRRDIDIIVSTIGNDELAFCFSHICNISVIKFLFRSELAALRFLSSGKVSIDKIMCSHYNMTNVTEAFQQLDSPNRMDSLVIVKCCNKVDTQENKKKEKTK